MTRTMECRGDWHHRFDPPGVVKFVAIVRGACWLRHGDGDPHMLRERDVLMLRGEHPFAMATDLNRPIDPTESP